MRVMKLFIYMCVVQISLVRAMDQNDEQPLKLPPTPISSAHSSPRVKLSRENSPRDAYSGSPRLRAHLGTSQSSNLKAIKEADEDMLHYLKKIADGQEKLITLAQENQKLLRDLLVLNAHKAKIAHLQAVLDEACNPNNADMTKNKLNREKNAHFKYASAIIRESEEESD